MVLNEFFLFTVHFFVSVYRFEKKRIDVFSGTGVCLSRGLLYVQNLMHYFREWICLTEISLEDALRSLRFLFGIFDGLRQTDMIRIGMWLKNCHFEIRLNTDPFLRIDI